MMTTEWQKSSKSGGNGGQCVEARFVPTVSALVEDGGFIKSERSNNTGACVEVSLLSVERSKSVAW